MFQYILFDLDGTLTDPGEGITKSVQFALSRQGIREADLRRLEPFIGPPLRESFMEFYNMTQEQAAMAVADYRKRFAPVGIYENKIYPGIADMLKHLKAAGIRLAVASSKPEAFVTKILAHFCIDTCFDVIVGSNMDGSRGEKEEVVAEALRRLGACKGRGAMVGDRKFDIQGGKKHGLTTVGVSFGYGGKGELEAAGADYIAKSVADLEKFLLRNRADSGKKAAAPGKKEERSGGGDCQDRRAVYRPGRDKRPNGIGYYAQSTWYIMLPFLVWYLAGNACYILVITLLRLVSQTFFSFAWLYENSLVLANVAKACSMLAGAGALIPLFSKERTGWKPRTRASYPVMGILAVSSALGVNILFAFLKIAAMSAGYYETEQMQYQIAFPAGLVLYGLISPLAEEALFRGLIYNRMKRYFSLVASGIASAALFGVYHGNLVQAMYGMLMGMLLTYAYEMTGRFSIPVMMHGLANICVFTAAYYPAVGEAVNTPLLCVIFLAVSAGCLAVVHRGRCVA